MTLNLFSTIIFKGIFSSNIAGGMWNCKKKAVVYMNIIEEQAQNYFFHTLGSVKSYDEFCYKISNCLEKYHEGVYKMIFLEHILLLLKQQYDRHDRYCSINISTHCRFKNLYENSLFVLTEYVKKTKQYLRKSELRELDMYNRLKFQDAEIIDIIRKNFIIEFNLHILREEVEKLREFYFLDKNTLSYLLVGKIFHLINIENMSTKKMDSIIQISDIIYKRMFDDSARYIEAYTKIKRSLTKLKLIVK